MPDFIDLYVASRIIDRAIYWFNRGSRKNMFMAYLFPYHSQFDGLPVDVNDSEVLIRRLIKGYELFGPYCFQQAAAQVIGINPPYLSTYGVAELIGSADISVGIWQTKTNRHRRHSKELTIYSINRITHYVADLLMNYQLHKREATLLLEMFVPHDLIADDAKQNGDWRARTHFSRMLSSQINETALLNEIRSRLPEGSGNEFDEYRKWEERYPVSFNTYFVNRSMVT